MPQLLSWSSEGSLQQRVLVSNGWRKEKRNLLLSIVYSTSKNVANFRASSQIWLVACFCIAQEYFLYFLIAEKYLLKKSDTHDM